MKKISAFFLILAVLAGRIFAATGYLIVTPSTGVITKGENSTLNINTSIGVSGTGIPEVPFGFTYQDKYYISGTAVYGTHYRILARAFEGGAYADINVAPNPNGEVRSFIHTTQKNFGSYDNRIEVQILDNSIQEGTRTLVIENPRSFSEEQDVHIEVRIKDNDLQVSPYSFISNLSTRGVVGSGSSVMIAGFIMSGSGSKSILARGIGPYLGQVGVPDALTDPAIALYDSSGNPIETNNDWKVPNQASIAATGLAPTNDKESAILRNLASGTSYTLVLSKASGTGSIGLVELYDVAGGSNPKLVNVSTRAYVGSGSSVLIAGFAISGGNKRVMIRGLGPTLSSFGVQGVLGNPKLTLYNSAGQVLEANNDWSDAWNASVIQSSPYCPPNSVEPAIVETLAPGNYTAILEGVTGGGVGLIDVFEY